MKPLITTLFFCLVLFNAPVLLAAGEGSATGTVAETIDAGGYVYLRLEEQNQWIAANAFKVNKGDRVQYSGGMEMSDFYSKSLDRTFESILFVSEAGLLGNGAADKPAKPMTGHGGDDMQINKRISKQAPAPGEIKHLSGGKTVADIFTESDQLNGQVVSLNARVIKISKHIMGKNWVTLQDGTGTEPDNRLLATTQEIVTPGDTVTVKGTVGTDIDLGFGYQYKVLLEEATFSEGLE